MPPPKSLSGGQWRSAGTMLIVSRVCDIRQHDVTALKSRLVLSSRLVQCHVSTDSITIPS